jgi:hypothetical protein
MRLLKTILQILHPVFSMFVLKTLIPTFMTTPLVAYCYPPHLRHRIAASEPTLIISQTKRALPPNLETRFTIVLDKLEHKPGIMALTQLVQPAPPRFRRAQARAPPGMNHGLRLRKASTIETRMQSDTADNIIWARYATPPRILHKINSQSRSRDDSYSSWNSGHAHK